VVSAAAQTGARFAERGSIDLTNYQAVKRWYDEMMTRPAVQRGLAVLASNSAIRRSVTPSAKTCSAQFAVR
jgi:hypothetical protein